MAESSIRYYLVGGAVRDLLWGRFPGECDYAFSGSPEAFVQANPGTHKAGRRDIQVFLLHGQEFMPLEGGTIETDLKRRDLTINALAVDENGLLYAHPQALADLRAKTLRAASDHSFADDPARVFRLARFAACFPDCGLDPQTLVLARRAAASPAYGNLPRERVGRETLKALAGPEPGRFLEVLEACGGFRFWFAELAAASSIPAGPPAYHRHHVLGHTVEVMNRAAGDPLAVWMSLCHDLGKLLTDPQGWPHHYGHEALGGEAAVRLAERLSLPVRYRRAGELASRLHMKAGKYETLRAGTRCDLLAEVHKAGLHVPFWTMAEADSGRALRPVVDGDLRAMLEVRLPDSWQDQGSASGRHLRELRCQVLASRRSARLRA